MKTLRHALLTLLVLTSWASAQNIPLAISYQAVLTDEAGNVLAPTTPTNYGVEFRISDAITAGNQLWAEAQGVSVYQGSFSTLLGTGDAITGEIRPQLDTIFNGAERYLEITVIEGTTSRTFTPRQQMVSTPFAFRAKFAEVAAQVTDGVVNESKLATNAVSRTKIADNAIDSSKIAIDAVGASEITANAVGSSELANGSVSLEDIAAAVANQLVPAGSVSAWAGFAESTPTGWILCDGRSLNKDTYPKLFTAIGYLYGGSGDNFNVPDYRGRFLRGQGSETLDVDFASRTKQPGAGERLDGSIQNDEFKSHNHNNGGYQYLLRHSGGWTSRYTDNTSTEPDLVHSSPIQARGGSETRPKNIYVHYMLKAH